MYLVRLTAMKPAHCNSSENTVVAMALREIKSK